MDDIIYGTIIVNRLQFFSTLAAEIYGPFCCILAVLFNRFSIGKRTYANIVGGLLFAVIVIENSLDWIDRFTMHKFRHR